MSGNKPTDQSVSSWGKRMRRQKGAKHANAMMWAQGRIPGENGRAMIQAMSESARTRGITIKELWAERRRLGLTVRQRKAAAAEARRRQLELGEA